MLDVGVVGWSCSSSTSNATSSSTSGLGVVVVVGVALVGVDVCGRLPGKSGTSTVTSDCSDSKLGSGVVVDVVVDAVVVVDVAVVVSGAASGVEKADVALTDASVVDTLVGKTVVVVTTLVGRVAFKPSVFHMVGPTDVNHGGRGRGVDDAGVALN